MSKPNRLALIATLLFFGGLAASNLARIVYADTGTEGAQRIEVGSYAETRVILVSSSAATEITNGASVKRPDQTCRNNSAYTLWIGSNTTGTDLSRVGFPVISSETFKLGALTGQVYGLADSAAAGTVNVRCWDGLVR